MRRLSLILVLAVFACAPADEGESVDAELCEHMIEGPAESVTAAATLDEAPDVSTEHTRYDVAVDGEGVVAYAAGEAGELLIALSAGEPVAFSQDGSEIEVEESRASLACSEVARVHSVDVAVGTLEIRIGPTDAVEVSVVIEHAEHAAEE